MVLKKNDNFCKDLDCNIKSPFTRLTLTGLNHLNSVRFLILLPHQLSILLTGFIYQRCRHEITEGNKTCQSLSVYFRMFRRSQILLQKAQRCIEYQPSHRTHYIDQRYCEALYFQRRCILQHCYSWRLKGLRKKKMKEQHGHRKLKIVLIQESGTDEGCRNQ